MKPDKIKVSLTLLIIVTVVLWIGSCTHQPDLSGLPEVCFDTEVLPVFLNNCAISGCHSGGGEEAMPLNSYSTIIDHVTPGNPEASAVYKAITRVWGENKMPPDQPLSTDNRTVIRVWIEQGASETKCSGSSGSGSGSGSGAYVARACFSRDIQPVLVSRCGTALCHDAITHKEGYNFTTYSSTMKAVTAGNPSNSILYQTIKYGTGEHKMPPSGKPQLTVAEIDSIGKWIGYGALNETCGETCDTIKPITFSGTIWPIMQTSCVGCHTGTAAGGGIRLENYSNVAAIAANGSLMKSLRGTGVTQMPKGSAFSTCRIRQFEIWVNNGYPNN